MKKLKPVFVDNESTRNFVRLMDAMERGEGEGRLACIHGRAGRGKTRTAQWWHANNPSVYLRTIAIWTPKGFLAALAFELGERSIPWSTSAAFTVVADLLTANPFPVFLDELERLPRIFLELVRDLTDSTGAPFILIGEEELPHWMSRERRVWSRTLEQLEFLPLTASDIISYGLEAGETVIDEDVADILNEAAGGDFRLIKRDLGALLRVCGNRKPTAKEARMIVRAGVRGK